MWGSVLKKVSLKYIADQFGFGNIVLGCKPLVFREHT